MKDKAMFIKTKDQETSEKLKTEGFKLVDYTNGIWTFINDPDGLLVFDDKKVTYSNILSF